jgi:hypothetical protein
MRRRIGDVRSTMRRHLYIKPLRMCKFLAGSTGYERPNATQPDESQETFSEEETVRRFEGMLKIGLQTPATPHDQMQKGRHRKTKNSNPAKRD